MHGKCPKCEQLITRIAVNGVTADAGPGRLKWEGLAYTCPHCQTILSVGIDPVALKSDTVKETVAQVAQLLRR